MSVRILGEVQVGVADLLVRDLRQLEAVTQSIISREITTLKNRLRRRVRAAGFSDRFANMIRGQVTVTQDTITGRVFSKGIVKRPGGPVDLVTLFWEGAKARRKVGGWYVIRNPDHVPNRRSTLDSFGGLSAFDIVPLPNRRSAMLLLKSNKDAGPYFFLVREFTIRSFYDLERDLSRAGLNLAERIDQDWGRRLVRQANTTRRAA